MPYSLIGLFLGSRFDQHHVVYLNRYQKFQKVVRVGELRSKDQTRSSLAKAQAGLEAALPSWQPLCFGQVQ